MKRFVLPTAITAMLIVAAVARAVEPVAAPTKQGKKTMQIMDADNGKTIKMAVPTSFNVALKGNATTGFQWKLDKIDGDAVQQKGKTDYVPDKHKEGMTGSGGAFIFSFNVTKAAKTKIRLIYVRPWEKDTPPAKTYELVIDSRPKSASSQQESDTSRK